MCRRLLGRVAIVTGGSDYISGLGAYDTAKAGLIDLTKSGS
jgi:NAD(P)-dependent dehydrogenase (short-subunit alcohol dehydrogenase family)